METIDKLLQLNLDKKFTATHVKKYIGILLALKKYASNEKLNSSLIDLILAKLNQNVLSLDVKLMQVNFGKLATDSVRNDDIISAITVNNKLSRKQINVVMQCLSKTNNTYDWVENNEKHGFEFTDDDYVTLHNCCDYNKKEKDKEKDKSSITSKKNINKKNAKSLFTTKKLINMTLNEFQQFITENDLSLKIRDVYNEIEKSKKRIKYDFFCALLRNYYDVDVFSIVINSDKLSHEEKKNIFDVHKNNVNAKKEMINLIYNSNHGSLLNIIDIEDLLPLIATETNATKIIDVFQYKSNDDLMSLIKLLVSNNIISDAVVYPHAAEYIEDHPPTKWFANGLTGFCDYVDICYKFDVSPAFSFLHVDSILNNSDKLMLIDKIIKLYPTKKMYDFIVVFANREPACNSYDSKCFMNFIVELFKKCDTSDLLNMMSSTYKNEFVSAKQRRFAITLIKYIIKNVRINIDRKVIVSLLSNIPKSSVSGDKNEIETLFKIAIKTYYALFNKHKIKLPVQMHELITSTFSSVMNQYYPSDRDKNQMSTMITYFRNKDIKNNDIYYPDMCDIICLHDNANLFKFLCDTNNFIVTSNSFVNSWKLSSWPSKISYYVANNKLNMCSCTAHLILSNATYRYPLRKDILDFIVNYGMVFDNYVYLLAITNNLTSCYYDVKYDAKLYFDIYINDALHNKNNNVTKNVIDNIYKNFKDSTIQMHKYILEQATKDSVNDFGCAVDQYCYDYTINNSQNLNFNITNSFEEKNKTFKPNMLTLVKTTTFAKRKFLVEKYAKAKNFNFDKDYEKFYICSKIEKNNYTQDEIISNESIEKAFNLRVKNDLLKKIENRKKYQ